MISTRFLSKIANGTTVQPQTAQTPTLAPTTALAQQPTEQPQLSQPGVSPPPAPVKLAAVLTYLLRKNAAESAAQSSTTPIAAVPGMGVINQPTAPVQPPVKAPATSTQTGQALDPRYLETASGATTAPYSASSPSMAQHP